MNKNNKCTCLDTVTIPQLIVFILKLIVATIIAVLWFLVLLNGGLIIGYLIGILINELIIAIGGTLVFLIFLLLVIIFGYVIFHYRQKSKNNR